MPDADGLRLRAIRYLAMALKAREDGDADFARCLAERATELSCVSQDFTLAIFAARDVGKAKAVGLSGCRLHNAV